MEDDTKAKRIEMYRSMNFLGTTDWAVSLDTAGVADQGSGDHNDDNDDDDDTGDLGLGRLPGLVLKEKLGKGAVQPQYHKNGKNYQEGMKQSWNDAGKIAKTALSAMAMWIMQEWDVGVPVPESFRNGPPISVKISLASDVCPCMKCKLPSMCLASGPPSFVVGQLSLLRSVALSACKF